MLLLGFLFDGDEGSTAGGAGGCGSCGGPFFHGYRVAQRGEHAKGICAHVGDLGRIELQEELEKLHGVRHNLGDPGKDVVSTRYFRFHDFGEYWDAHQGLHGVARLQAAKPVPAAVVG
jgi:hypothetical protein